MTTNADTLRAAAAVSCEAALRWLTNSGPNDYDLAEALTHLAQAAQLANAAADAQAARYAIPGSAEGSPMTRPTVYRDASGARFVRVYIDRPPVEGIGDAAEVRQGVIRLRIRALAAQPPDFAAAVLLSHAIAWLSTLDAPPAAPGVTEYTLPMYDRDRRDRR